MSVRRRAIQERVARDGMRRKEFERLKAMLSQLRDLCERKMLAGDSNITAEELQACLEVPNG